jgi:hypothetical protein
MSIKGGRTNSKKASKRSFQKRAEKGYQPVRGRLDTSNPPKGGSGVPQKSGTSIKTNKKD